MKIEKLPSGSYRVRKMVDGKSHAFTFDHRPTQKEIDAAIAEALNKNVTLRNAPSQTFRQCAVKYMDVKRNVLSASTIAGYKSYLENIGSDFAELAMKDIDSVAVQKVANDLAADHSPKTVKNYTSFITAVVGMFCPKLDLEFTIPKPVKNEPYIPTSEEVRAILDASNDKYYIVLMLGCYGLRRSEIIALEYPDDFDAENCSVYVRKAIVRNDEGEYVVQHYNKTTESRRHVPVSKDLIDRIASQGHVYSGHPDKILEYLHTRQKQLGIQQFRFHDLRHYFATELDQGGFSSKDIQALGGWSSDSILKTIYQHNRVKNSKDLQRKAADLISGNLLQ
jgi:integrase